MPHTPGPWRLAKVVGTKAFSAGGEQVYRIDARTTLDLVVAPFSDGYVLGENEANAKLIAAAPDLLNVCQRAYECCYDKNSEDGKALKAAIDKATSA